MKSSRGVLPQDNLFRAVYALPVASQSRAVSDAPWDGSASRFSDQQYAASCILDRAKCGAKWKTAPAKERYSLPIKEPNGTLNRNAVHAAASRIGQVQACPAAISAAKASLRSAYKTLGEDAPASLGASPADSGASSDELRAVSLPEGGTGRTLDLQWYVADRWTEIDSNYEGHFMERIAPGAAAKTIAENRSNMRILLQHGKDPQLGNKPIATIDDIGENNIGGYARGELFPGLDPLVVDGIRAGQYGASFRFGVLRDDFVRNPEPSEYNPNGIPERTIREMAVQEFGPVTWGAYSAASAGVRSITDEIHFSNLAAMPAERLAELVRFWQERDGVRMDADDLSTLGQMIACGSQYILEQDDSDDPNNIPTMEKALELLSTLVPVEVAEDEPSNPDMGGEHSAPDSDELHSRDESRRNVVPVEAPAKATPTTDMYLSKRQRAPRWHLS